MGTMTTTTMTAEEFEAALARASRTAAEIVAAGRTLVPDVCDAETADLLLNYADGTMRRYHEAQRAGDVPPWALVNYDPKDAAEELRRHLAMFEVLAAALPAPAKAAPAPAEAA
jgi:hypothetical protein